MAQPQAQNVIRRYVVITSHTSELAVVLGLDMLGVSRGAFPADKGLLEEYGEPE